MKELEIREAKMTQINMELKDKIYQNDIAMKKIREQFAMYTDCYVGPTNKSGHFCPDSKNIIWKFLD